MDDDSFWALVDAARDAAGDDTEDRVSGLEQVLLTLHADEVFAFQHAYDETLARAWRWDLWGAAYLMNGGCSDDGFRYFCDWLISEGESVFEAALDDPESLAAKTPGDEFSLEAFGYVAAEVYEQMTDNEMPRRKAAQPASPAGKAWDESELPARFPKLAAKFGG